MHKTSFVSTFLFLETSREETCRVLTSGICLPFTYKLEATKKTKSISLKRCGAESDPDLRYDNGALLARMLMKDATYQDVPCRQITSSARLSGQAGFIYILGVWNQMWFMVCDRGRNLFSWLYGFITVFDKRNAKKKKKKKKDYSLSKNNIITPSLTMGEKANNRSLR